MISQQGCPCRFLICSRYSIVGIAPYLRLASMQQVVHLGDIVLAQRIP